MSLSKSAVAAIDVLIAKTWDNPRALMNLVHTLLIPRGTPDQIMAARTRSVSLAAGDPEIEAMSISIGGRLVDSWYFSMVQDEIRHARYAEALERVITPDSIVLDIGSGTGLFAMMAARAGASLVVGCEQNPMVARAAQEVVRANGLDAVVRIVAKPLAKLEIGPDLPRRADVVLWDNLANNLLGAGCLPVLTDARRRLAQEDAVMIPERVEVRVALAEDLRPLERAMDHAAGFDLTAFNHLRKTGVTIKPDQFARRSDGTTIFQLHLTAGSPQSAGERQATVRATGGKVNCVVQWLRFHLVEGITYDTSSTDVTAFGHQYHHIPDREVVGGEQVTIYGSGNGQDDWFWVD